MTRCRSLGNIPTSLSLAAALAVFAAVVGSASRRAEAEAKPGLQLRSVEPTVFFVRQKDALLQVAEATIESQLDAVDASLEVTLGKDRRSTALGKLRKGILRVQVHVPDLDRPEFHFEGTHSVIKPLRDQFPGSNSNYYAVQHWADVGDGRRGVTLAAIESHLLEFGGLWPCYVSQAHHGVTPPDFGRPFVTAEQLSKGHMVAFALDANFRTNFPSLQSGDLLFRYSIAPRRGGWKQGAARDFGWSVGNPLVAVAVDGKNHQGKLASFASFCRVQPAGAWLLTLKRAEDGDGLIVRIHETDGAAASATVTFPHLTIRKAWTTNLVEENQAELTCDGHEARLSLAPFGISTIRLRAN